MRKFVLLCTIFVFACGGVDPAQASSFEPSAYEKGSDPTDEDIKNQKIANVAIGGALRGVALFPTIANIYALVAKKRQSLWGGVGVFSAVFLSGMTVYIGGTGGFFESATSKHYIYSMLPVWGTSLALLGLGVANLVQAKKARKYRKPKFKRPPAEPHATGADSQVTLVGEFHI